MKVLLRADASTEVGTGHAMRCLALGQALRDIGAEVTLASVALAATIGDRYLAEGIDIAELGALGPGSRDDARAVHALASGWDAGWVVTDGYRFGSEYHESLRGPWRRLVVDDLGGVVPPVECLLNGNAYASVGLYAGAAPDCELLLGPRYAPLRRDFRHVSDRVPSQRVERVVVTFGGADPDNLSLRVMEALAGLDTQVQVVIGTGHPDPQAVRAAAARLRQDVLADVQSMAALLGSADVVVGAGGTSALEYVRCGTPAILVVLAENQARVVPALAEAGVAVDAGVPDPLLGVRIRSALERLDADPSLREGMARRGRALVDGRGAGRVARIMTSPPLTLRRAALADSALLLEWANDAEIRVASFRSGPIESDEHAAWFASRLADAQVRIWICELGGRPVGVARFEPSGDRAVISISLAPGRRGEGLGPRLISAASRKLFAELPVMGIDAWMRADNVRSAAAFRSAGYAPRGATPPPGAPADARLMSIERAERA